MKQAKFSISNTPTARLSLFEKQDNFIWCSRFRNDLPDISSMPKSVSYHQSADILKNADAFLLRDLPRAVGPTTNAYMNSSIEADLMNEILASEGIAHSLNLPKEYHSEVLSIIKEDKQKTVKKSGPSNYLRATTFLTSTYNKGFPNANQNQNKDEKSLEESKEVIIEKIANTFDTINSVVKGMEHPEKKGVFAEKVLDVLPLDNCYETKIVELNFPEAVETNQEKLLLEEDPLSEGIFNLYEQEENVMGYARSMAARKSHAYDIYNNYLLFCREDKAFVYPLHQRFILKKVKGWSEQELLKRKRRFEVEDVVSQPAEKGNDELEDLF